MLFLLRNHSFVSDNELQNNKQNVKLHVDRVRPWLNACNPTISRTIRVKPFCRARL